MKHLKHMLAATLAVFLAFVLAVPAFASSIEVTQSTSDGTAGTESYTAYKIFDVTKTDAQKDYETTAGGPGTAEGFAYTISKDSAWLSVVQNLKDSNSEAYYTLTPSAEGDVYVVELRDSKYNTEAYAKEIAEKLLAAKPATMASVDKSYSFTTGQKATVDDGYYLITSSLGTNLILATSDITIQEKNQYVVDNKIAETASVSIGENATYYIEVFIPATVDTTKKVTVHDNLADELKFNNNSVQVYVGTADPGSTAAEYKALTYAALSSAYNLKTTGLTDDCDFEIEITTTDLAGKYLVFKYSAQLTSAADADGDGYANEEFSTYSNYKTTPTTPVVKTYDFDFTKVDGDGAKLDGAEFELYAAWDDAAKKPSGNPIALIADGTDYKKADTDDASTVTTIAVNSKTNNAATNISGLGGADDTNGTNYYLVETKAPTGFNKLTAPIIVNVKDNGTITVSLNGKTLASASDAFNVENNTGTVLPSTGGIGTTILYIVGGILIVGGCVALVTKRRMASIEK